MKKILLIDDSDTYTWCLQKYLQHRGYPVKTACTLKEARTAIQEEMPLVVCCDLDLPDGSGMDFLDEVRAADKELPFILASCHDKDDYEQEAMRRGATLCMDKMKGLLLQDKLVEYAYRQLSGEKAPTFHKLLFVYAEDTSAEVLRAAMLQKGFDLILVSSIWEAKRRILRIRNRTDLVRSGTAGRHSNGAVSYATAGGGDVPNEESPCPASAVLYPHREQRPCHGI